MAYRDLTPDEQRVVQIVLDVVPEWKKIMTKQIRYAHVDREDLYSMYVIKFSGIPKLIRRVPNSWNVPFSVYILPGNFEEPKITFSFDGRIFFADDETETGAVIGIVPVFRKGVLFELEVYTSTLEKVDFSGIENGQRCYQVRDQGLLDKK